jgi:predicted transcriptional regulator
MENLYSFQEIADQLGITLQEFCDFCKKEGLIDESGRATPKAIENGLMINFEIGNN